MELLAHGMQRAGLQFILRIANDRQLIAKIQCHVTALAALFVHAAGESSLLGQSLNLADEFAPFMRRSVSDIFVRNAN